MRRFLAQAAGLGLVAMLLSCSTPANKPVLTSEPRVAEARPGEKAQFDSDGHTPLTRAAKEGDLGAVRRLLEAGARIDERSQVGDTPLNYAIWYTKPEVAELLVDRGANPNLAGPKGTPLLFAVQRGRVELVKLLLAIPGIDVNGLHPEHHAPLEYAVGETFRPAIAKLLLARGAKIDVEVENGWTPLMWACWRGRSVEQVRFMLDQGADPRRRNRDGETAYTKAAQAARLELLKELESRGVKERDVRLGRSETVDPKLSEAQRWALATAALRTLVDGKSVEILGGVPAKRPAQQSVKAALERTWKIEDREDLLTRLEELASEGQRGMFATWAEWARSDAAWAAAEGAKPPRELVTKVWTEVGGKVGVAWDFCRYIKLVDEGFLAGYLTQEEAWELIMPAARTLQKHFESWADLGACYLHARSLWLHGDPDESMPRMRYLYPLLANERDPLSPWTKNAWRVSLGAGPALPL